MTIILINDDPDDTHEFLCGELHSYAFETAPELYVQRSHFSSTDVESHIILGRGSRQLVFDVWINDASFTTRNAIDEYLLELDQLVGRSGSELVIDRPELFDEAQIYANCYFMAFYRQALPGQPAGVPIPNVFPDATIGPQGNFWLPGQLVFTQVIV